MEHTLDLAAERRREKQVVDVEVQVSLIVVFELDPAAGGMTPKDEHHYGLPAPAVESIIAVDEITYVPGTPPWILGVVNVRGEIESVLDLRAVLGFAPARLTAESRLLIAQEGELRSGLLVDRMVDIVDIPASAISPAPTPLEGGKGIYVQGEAEYAGKPLVVLDLGEILDRALEQDRV
jgi:purine-binding chemotaxis protein CheW